MSSQRAPVVITNQITRITIRLPTALRVVGRVRRQVMRGNLEEFLWHSCAGHRSGLLIKGDNRRLAQD
jgi:hypothetical protein